MKTYFSVLALAAVAQAECWSTYDNKGQECDGEFVDCYNNCYDDVCYKNCYETSSPSD